MRTLSVWIFGLLCASVTGAQELNHFPKNFVVAKSNDENPVTLTCDTKFSGDITWRFTGVELQDVDFEDNVQQDGKKLTVTEVETPMLGEYSCWNRGEMLSSIYLLLEVDNEEELDSLISCRAKSYNCNFSCTWTHSGYTAVRLGLGQDCSNDGKSCQWVSRSDHLQDGRFHFELSHALSPYTEETTMLELTVEAIINHYILRRTKRFYLRDIVQPDSPQIVKCQEVEQHLNVTIEPPSSWSTPHSFFSLEHEIEYVFKDDGKIGRCSCTLIPSRISMLRARSRDSLVHSIWSQWTPWKNVTD